jgi:hypothetical protein
LLESAAELARILAASSLIGGAIGGVLGSVPGAAVGGVLGLKAGGWVLGGQEKGLNALTIHEYVAGRAAFAAGDVKRDPQKARMARMEYAEKMQEQHSEELRAIGVPYGDAIRLAKIRTGEKMNALAALHNPDLIGGGKDIISDFGDRQVNSSIGPQWKSRARHIDDAVQIHLNSGDAGDLLEMKNERMSTSLTRCI